MRKRYSAKVINSPRWPALRMAAKRRDGFKCRQCGSVLKLEVHHEKPVRTHPELAYDLDNLATLCSRCHARVTRIEVGLGSSLDAERAKWDVLINELCRSNTEN
jgi:5-methylcytosine-specific restriction enzyme A